MLWLAKQSHPKRWKRWLPIKSHGYTNPLAGHTASKFSKLDAASGDEQVDLQKAKELAARVLANIE
jgi:hypothetical protein